MGAIWRDETVRGGAAVVGGTLVTVAEILTEIRLGASPEEVAHRLPGIGVIDVWEALIYAAEEMEDELEVFCRAMPQAYSPSSS
jgi:uncharacterized protein (DUF433 family)